jgi:hypothetical protein
LVAVVEPTWFNKSLVTGAGGSSARTLEDRFTHVIDVRDYGAVGNGTTDDTAAVQAAITAAYSTGKRAVYFPPGTYWFALASASLDPGIGPIDFFGAGMGASVLKYDEGTSATFGAAGHKCLFKNTANTTKYGITFRDMGFRGTLFDVGGRLNTGGPAIALDWYDNITLDHCRVSYTAHIATQCEAVRSVNVTGCEFHACIRDMCRFRSSFNVTITGNTFRHCVDDPIALHQAGYIQGDGKVREGITVTGNTFEDTHRLCILGGRNVVVSGNTMRRSHGFWISSDGPGGESPNATFAIKVSDNIIEDTLDTVYTPILVTSADARGTAESGGSTFVPGAGTLQPYAYRDNNQDTAADALAVPAGLTIQNNTILRTLPTVANYSAWGFGLRLQASGWTDLPVTDAALRPTAGIQVTFGTPGLIVSGNVVRNCTDGIRLVGTPPSNSCTGRVAGNVIFDCLGKGLLGQLAAAARVTLRVSDNVFNCDPYHISTLRGAGGTWSAVTDCVAIQLEPLQGVSVEHNTFLNCSRAVYAGLGAVDLLGNTVICDPSASGVSASNKGVSDVPRASASWFHQIVDCDPSSGTFGDLKNVCVRSSNAAIPTAGTYVVGHFVHNTAPSVGATGLLYGWLRLTTGTAHVNGTDWAEVALPNYSRTAGTLSVAASMTAPSFVGALTGTASSATTLAAGADRTKLDGIAAGATVNSTDAALRDRTTHTGAQAISTVTGLQGALDLKAPLASPTFTGTVVAPAFTATTSSGLTASAAYLSAAVELGATAGVANTPYIDFHSGATAVDYDSRIIASGGTGAVQQGTLTYQAGSHVFNGRILPNISDYADDVAAAAAGVPVGALYRTGNSVKVRVS